MVASAGKSPPGQTGGRSFLQAGVVVSGTVMGRSILMGGAGFGIGVWGRCAQPVRARSVARKIENFIGLPSIPELQLVIVYS